MARRIFGSDLLPRVDRLYDMDVGDTAMTDKKFLDLADVLDGFKEYADDWFLDQVSIDQPPEQVSPRDGWAKYKPGPMKTITMVLRTRR